ncbi:MAG: ABC transporter ATP-binding protein [Planctomycetota bacterium]
MSASESSSDQKPPPTLGDARRMVVRLLPFIRPYRNLLLLTLVFVGVKISAGPVMAWMVKRTTRFILDNQNLSAVDMTPLYWFIASVIAFLFLHLVGCWYRHFLPTKVSSKVSASMRKKLYRHVQTLSADFHEGRRSGEIVSRLTSDIERGRFMMASAFINSFMDLAMVALVLPIALYISPLLTLVAYVPGLISAVIYWKLLPAVRSLARETQKKMGKITGEISEKIQGIKMIQSYTVEETEARLVGTTVNEHRNLTILQARYASTLSAFTEFWPNVGTVLVWAIGATLVLRNSLALDELMMFIFLLGQMYFPLKRSAETMTQVADGLGALDNVFSFFDERPSIAEKSDAVPPSEPIVGTVSIEKVHFRYPLKPDAPVLRCVSVNIPAGTRAALVGPSGSGKSTIASLLCRFYDPQSGSICIDGFNIRELPIRTLRQNVALVSQDVILFSGSIRENLMLGDPDADETRMIKALIDAGAWEFIEKLEHGLETQIGEHGLLLSGGQKQRLSIARAFLKNARILVLDEATAALDAGSEEVVQSALERLMVGRTTIIIAHRLSTIASADQILCVVDGQIIERGQHQELLDKRGVYSRLWNQQFHAALEPHNAPSKRSGEIDKSSKSPSRGSNRLMPQ